MTASTFLSEGAVHLPGAVSATWCAAFRGAIADSRTRPSQFYGVLSQPGRPVVDSDLFRWFDTPLLADALFGSELPAIAASLLGTDAVVFVEDQWFASAPGADTASPWHQDAPYYNIDGEFVTLWLALDDAPAAAALRVVPGSHRWGRTFAPVEFATSTSTIGGAGGLEPVPETGELDRQALGWDVSAGDIIALDPFTLHSAGAAPLPGGWFRRLSTRWAAPSACYVDRGEQAATFWSLLPHGRKPGDLLACDVFPLLSP